MIERNEGFSWIDTIKIAGAWISFCIGSGFATGQELLQYFGAYGVYGFGAIVIAMILHTYCSVSFLKAGHEQQFESSLDIFDYYCGKTLGKIVKLLSVVFLVISPMVMIAGFGASLNQFFNVPLGVGAGIMGVLSIITVLLGLRKMVDIIGAIGPVIIVVTLLTGGIFLVTHVDTFASGMEMAPSLASLKIDSSWMESGMLYATWAPMISAPFLVASATTVKSGKSAAWGGILGTIFYGLACAIMIAAFFCIYDVVSVQAVPTLYLANLISPVLGYAFLAIIFLGIYSSAVPSLFNFCAAFFREGTKPYKIFTVIAIAITTVVSVTVPFGTLLNYVYTFYGYLGILITVLVPVKQIRVYLAKKKEAVQ